MLPLRRGHFLSFYRRETKKFSLEERGQPKFFSSSPRGRRLSLLKAKDANGNALENSNLSVSQSGNSRRIRSFFTRFFFRGARVACVLVTVFFLTLKCCFFSFFSRVLCAGEREKGEKILAKQSGSARARKRERVNERERVRYAKTYYAVTFDAAKMRGGGFPAIFFLFHPQTRNFAIRRARQTSKREQVLSGLTRNRG